MKIETQDTFAAIIADQLAEEQATDRLIETAHQQFLKTMREWEENPLLKDKEIKRAQYYKAMEPIIPFH